MESFDDTVVALPTDPPITDAVGHVYSLASGSLIIVDGQPDRSAPNVSKLAYSGRQVWYQNHNNQWFSRHRHTDPWSPSPVSPLSKDRFFIIEAGIASILSGQLALAADGETDQVAVIAAINAIPGTIANQAVVLAAIQSEQAALTALLNNIIALLSVNLPTKLALDLSGASIASQPVPDKPGP
jgi:hypothetical protein